MKKKGREIRVGLEIFGGRKICPIFFAQHKALGTAFDKVTLNICGGI